MKERRKLEELLNNKIKKLEDNQKKCNKDELEKFKTLYRLITNQYNMFFSKIDVNIALKILKDIGIEENELQDIYIKLMQEEISGEYILIDEDLKDKEERQ